MALGEVFLGAFLQVLFDRLASSELLKWVRGGVRVHKELQKWSEMLSMIQAVLEDAEEKQLADKTIKNWLHNLRDLAYDVEDILDEFVVESARQKLKTRSQASTNEVPKSNLVCSRGRVSLRVIQFKLRMLSKMKIVTSRLSNILKQRIELGLEIISRGASSNMWQRPPSTSILNETRVFGRDKDREKMLELLSRDEPSEVNFHVIPIVGMGGVGKTTLAQLIYNDNEVRCFNMKAWVCVSEEFDILRITKAILESITCLPCDLKDFDQIQVKLKEAVAGKRFLIVFDDVWNKNYGDWTRLQAPFRAAAAGSKIIVTTRDVNVGLMMGADKYHCLGHISNDDCWSVFAQHAFENKDVGAHPNLAVIGRKIVEKCKGLPLAARTLGGLLRSKQRDDEWEDVLHSKLWNLSDEESEILPVLRLSYHHLPSHLKRCFSYCSILPKDYEFEEKELVFLWMAEGLLQQPEENKQMEDLGCEYFREFLSRSLFQRSSVDQTKFVMHDLISDLAQWVAGDVCFTLEDKLDGNRIRRLSPKARHSSYICGQYDDVKRFEALFELKYLRTFLPLLPPYLGKCYLTDYVPSVLLPKLKCLRILSLMGYNITVLPKSIGELKLLRYLNFSHTNIRSLPKSISSLYSLQTLFLRDCLYLKELPKDMGNLINLRHLDISNGRSIKEMPLGMKKLTNLQMLSDFVVGKDTGSSIRELMGLRFLSGALRISGLENVTDAWDAREANLKNKEDLDVLFLMWGSGFDDSRNERVETEVLDMLQPHSKLKELTVKCYGGTKFPTWLGDPSFCCLVFLKLENCERCKSLPPLGLLPSLRDLSIVGMSGIQSVGPEFYGQSFSRPFPTLETLHFQAMPEWEDWIGCGGDYEEFPRLSELRIEGCPKLSGILPSSLSSLRKLVIFECKQLVVSIPNLPMLCKLQIEECKEVISRGLVNFSSPNTMVVSAISNFTCLKTEFIQRFNNLKELKIFYCDELPSLWQNYVELDQCLASLRHLVIKGCPQLVTLVAEEAEEEEHLQQERFCELEYLELRHCESLLTLPQRLNTFVSLRELAIEGCPRLVSFPESGLPPSLRVIRIKNCNGLAPLPAAAIYNSSYLENLYIEGCDSLMYFGRNHLPLSLKRLEISSCKNLQRLLSDEGSSFSASGMHEQDINIYNLEYLHIYDCPSLLSLSSSGLSMTLKHLQIKNCSELAHLFPGGNLSSGLKHLSIEDCPKLESIADRFQDYMSLESIIIVNCARLVSLPRGLHNLTNLHEIFVWHCPGFISFPRGLPTANLRELCISSCEHLEALPYRLHSLTSLQELWIYDCPGIITFPEDGFPTKLMSLTIVNLNICKPLFEWGLHRLNSLRELYIEGGCTDVLSFPQDEIQMVLPSSLRNLTIIEFSNLKYLSARGFQNLNSLEYLSISYCNKLASFPEKGLPSSLLHLCIYGCPLLKKRCKKHKGPEWVKIAHVPCVRIDGRLIHEH